MSAINEKFNTEIEEGVTQFKVIEDMYPVRAGQIIVIHNDDTSSMPEFVVDGQVKNVSISLLELA